MPREKKKILVIAPHMDDEVLGVGGTIARHVGQGDHVWVCIIAHRVYDNKFDAQKNEEQIQNTMKAKNILGYQEIEFLNLDDERLDVAIQDIIIPLEKVVLNVEPDVVYSCFYGDNNQDHRASFDAIRVVLRPSAKPFVKSWYLYETPSSTDQSPPIMEAAFLPNHFVDIKETFRIKMEAYKSYETERRANPHPRSYEAIEALATLRGAHIGFEMAEAFMTMRSVWDSK